jgi:hypothetical protein
MLKEQEPFGLLLHYEKQGAALWMEVVPGDMRFPYLIPMTDSF